MRRTVLLVGVMAVAVVLAAGASGSMGSGQARWVIREIGALPGCTTSEAVAINDDGWVVGSCRTRSGRSRAFVWRQGRLTNLGSLGGDTFAAAVNNRGQIVGSSFTSTGVQHPFVWQDEKMVDLGTPAEMREAGALAINDRGQIVEWANARPPARTALFLWQSGKAKLLRPLPRANYCEFKELNELGQAIGRCDGPAAPDPTPGVPDGDPGVSWSRAILWQGGMTMSLGVVRGGTHSAAVALNDRGQIAGNGAPAAGGGRGFLWQKGKMRDLGSLGGVDDVGASDINSRGEVVGGSSTKSFFRAFLWRNGRMINLGTLIRTGSSNAIAINDVGQVVGTADVPDSSGGRSLHAFVWQNGTMTDLGTTRGAQGSVPIAVNERGQILGRSMEEHVTAGGYTTVAHPVLWTLRSG